MIYAVKRFLRSPLVIVAEIAALALLCALGAALPQQGTATGEELARWQESGPFVQAIVQMFSLDRVFSSVWFLALTLLTSASLLVVVVAQVNRLCAQCLQRLRPAQGQNGTPEAGRESSTKNRLAMAGPALFHAGLLLVILAGALRALFGTEAVVDLIEGETLAPTAQAWAAQWPGALAKPFHLDYPVTLNQVRAVRYQSGNLKDLTINLAVRGQAGTENIIIAANHAAQVGGQRLFLASEYGAAAFMEWQLAGQTIKRDAALLSRQANDCFEGELAGPNNLRAYLRAPLDLLPGGHLERVEVRVMRDHALLYTGDVHLNEAVALPGGVRLALQGAALWARLRGNRDAALGLAYTGFALVVLGAVLIFFVSDKPARLAGGLLLVICMTGVTGCQRPALAEARQLVERYNQVVAEAYRRGDVRLIDPVVGPNEGKKLTGLIGVRLDLGITLDSRLLSLQVTSVEKSKNEMRVRTQERWHYRDLKIGTGQQVGEASLDAYEMLYIFKKIDKAWMVDEIRFTAPPQVGRRQTSWLAERKDLPEATGPSPSQEGSRP